MKIQFISYMINREFESENITCKTFSNPLAFDNFDITVISLQNAEIWKNKNRGMKKVDCLNDLINLGQMNTVKQSSLVLFLLPQDYLFRSDEGPHSRYYYCEPIRNVLSDVTYLINNAFSLNGFALSPGAEITSLNHGEYPSAFSICTEEALDEHSFLKGNGNGITVYRTSNYAATTIQIENGDSLLDFLKDIEFIKQDSVSYPDWLDTISFLDEPELLKQLSEKRSEIAELEQQCTSIEERLASYREKKSILCSKDEELQSSVVSMLEEIFPREEKFLDKGEEDYQYETDSRAFLFEIKGSNKSLKRDHISKTDNHVQVYKDVHENDQEKKTPKGILIFSEEINKSPSEHLPYVKTQIELAKRYEVLIIPASDLLKLYERFHKGETTFDQILDELWNRTGLWSNQ